MPKPVLILIFAALVTVPQMSYANEMQAPRSAYASPVRLVVPDQPLQGRLRAVPPREWTLAEIKADQEWRDAVSERLRRLSP